MSVRFVACVTRYSRGAVNRCGGKYNTGFITIFLRCIIAKNYLNWPRIDKVIGKIKKVQFFLNIVFFVVSNVLLCMQGCAFCKDLGPDFQKNLELS